MNEEEKQAIHYFDNKIGDFELLYGKKITTQENEYLKLLLNLINKQQKEIEELRNPIICGRTIEEVIKLIEGE